MKRTIVWFTAIYLLLTVPLFQSVALAEEPRLDNIIVTNTRDDLLLYLSAKSAFPKKIIEAVQSGVPTTFTFYINLYRVRGLWLDKRVRDIKLSHKLKYDTLKNEYVVTRSWEGNRPLTVKTFEEAKQLMSEVDSLVTVCAADAPRCSGVLLVLDWMRPRRERSGARFSSAPVLAGGSSPSAGAGSSAGISEASTDSR